MTTSSTPLPTGGSFADHLTRFRQSLDLAEAVTGVMPTRTRTNGLNEVKHLATGPLADLSTQDLVDLIARGNVVDVQVRLATWRLSLRRGDGDVTEEEGSIAEAVDQPRLAALQTALASREFADIVNLLGAHEADVTIWIRNDPQACGTHWVAQHSVLTDALATVQWIPFARRLTSGPANLLVDDLDDAVLSNGALCVHGPAAAVVPVGLDARRQTVSDTDDAFRGSRAAGGSPLPSPALFAPVKHTAGAFGPAAGAVTRAVNDLGFLLIWALLANTASPVAGGIHVTVSGARELDVIVEPAPRADAAALLEMYLWVATSPEVDRLYFVQQALTLAVVSSDDIATAAAPAFRTARSLYDLSRQTSVAEVMAARRSAREMALAASRSAAGVAREAAGKAVERTLVQVAGAAGIAVVRFQNALPEEVTTWLLLLIAALCLASALITDRVTLLSATKGLNSELQDLDRYRDSLSTADIDDVKSVGAVSAARSDIRNARITAWVTYGAAVLAVLAALVFLPNGTAASPKDPRSPDSPPPTSEPSQPASQPTDVPTDVQT